MAAPEPDTEQLLAEAARGDADARQQLLVRHQQRLRQMIAVRMDQRMAARVDPSDIVQETFVKAMEKLTVYLKKRPLPFYPWLRQLALDQLLALRRHHVQAQKRSVAREAAEPMPLSDGSVQELAGRLLSRKSNPSGRLRRDERRSRVQAALEQLPDTYREVLVLRHLEQLSTREIAAILGVTQGAVYTRHVRALDHLRRLLGPDLLEGES